MFLVIALVPWISGNRTINYNEEYYFRLKIKNTLLYNVIVDLSENGISFNMKKFNSNRTHKKEISKKKIFNNKSHTKSYHLLQKYLSENFEYFSNHKVKEEYLTITDNPFIMELVVENRESIEKMIFVDCHNEKIDSLCKLINLFLKKNEIEVYKLNTVDKEFYPNCN